jgi:hypothetical protein
VAFKQITRSMNPVLYRDQLIALVNERFDFSQKYSYSVRNKLPRLYDVWRGIYTGRFHPHKNNVHIPLIFAAVWADAAHKASASLNTWPIVEFRGTGPDDKPVALKHENLVSAQMKDADSYKKEINTHVIAGLYGRAISTVMWDRREEMATFDEYTALPVTGEMVRSIRKDKVVTFDGPNHESVDRLDFFEQPGPIDIPLMKWCGRRFYLDLDDVRVLSSGENPIFDPAEVARMEREGAGAEHAAADVETRRYLSRLGMSDDNARNMDKFSRPVEIREYWGIIPSEYAVDGEVNVVVSVMNRKYLGRARGNPFWHRQKPFVSHAPTPDPQSFDAPGKAEVAEKLQLTANRYVNQRLDAADIMIDPMWFYDRNAGINTENLYAKPGRWIGTDGDPNGKVLPMPIDLRGLQAGASLTAEMMSHVERAMGISDDAGQGLQSAGSQTAREFVGRREAGGTRLLLESRLYQRLNRQMLKGPVEYHILGDSAQKDPDTGAPIQETRERLEGYELARTYQARAVGATSNLSRMARRQDLIPLLQAVSTNPYAAGAVNFVNFFRQIFREFDIQNVNELISQNAQQNTQMAQVMAQAQGGGAANPAAIPDTGLGSGDQTMALAQMLSQQGGQT